MLEQVEQSDSGFAKRGHERARGDGDVVAACLLRVGDEVPAVGGLESLDMGDGGVEPVNGGVIGGEIKSDVKGGGSYAAFNRVFRSVMLTQLLRAGDAGARQPWERAYIAARQP